MIPKSLDPRGGKHVSVFRFILRFGQKLFKQPGRPFYRRPKRRLLQRWAFEHVQAGSWSTTRSVSQKRRDKCSCFNKQTNRALPLFRERRSPEPSKKQTNTEREKKQHKNKNNKKTQQNTKHTKETTQKETTHNTKQKVLRAGSAYPKPLGPWGPRCLEEPLHRLRTFRREAFCSDATEEWLPFKESPWLSQKTGVMTPFSRCSFKASFYGGSMGHQTNESGSLRLSARPFGSFSRLI